MKWIKHPLFALVVLAILLAAGVWLGLPRLNDYQVQGETTLPGLERKVTVTRDEKGMAYIHAVNLSDAVKVQGFVTAQDRLFQMQLIRLLAQGPHQ